MENTTQDENVEYTDETFQNVYIALRNLQGLVTIFVNLLTVVIIVKYKRLHSSSNVLIGSLAVADFITGVSTPIAFAHIKMERSQTGASDWSILCLLGTWLSVVASSGNFIHVLLISVDRFIAIKKPVFYRNSVNKRRVAATASSGWLVTLVSTSLYVTVGRNMDLSLGDICIWNRVFKPVVYTYMIVVPVICTSFLSTCLYIAVGYMVRKRSKQTGPAKNSESRRLMQQRKITKMMALVTVTYYALYLPATIENFIHYDVTVKYYVSRGFIFLFFTNALINPFIYSGQSSEFNSAYRRILRLKPKNDIDLNE